MEKLLKKSKERQEIRTELIKYVQLGKDNHIIRINTCNLKLKGLFLCKTCKNIWSNLDLHLDNSMIGYCPICKK